MRRRAWLSSAVLLAVVAALGLAGCSAEQQPAPAPRIIEPAPPIPAPRTPEPAPAARSNPALVLAPGGNTAVLFGGLTASGFAADTWILPLGGDPTWQESDVGEPLPAARSSHDTAVAGAALYLFGGLSDKGPLADLWHLDLTGD